MLYSERKLKQKDFLSSQPPTKIEITIYVKILAMHLYSLLIYSLITNLKPFSTNMEKLCHYFSTALVIRCIKMIIMMIVMWRHTYA